MSAAANPNDVLKNHLLVVLPADGFRARQSQPVCLKLGEVLYESGDKISNLGIKQQNKL